MSDFEKVEALVINGKFGDSADLELRQAIKALPRERLPTRDLWPGIASQFHPQSSAAKLRGGWRLPASIAAAAMLAVLTGLFLQPRIDVISIDSQTITAVQNALQQSDLEFENAKALLFSSRQALATQPASNYLIAAEMELIASEAALRQALQLHPNNVEIFDQIQRVQKRHLRLLRKELLS